MQKNPKNRIISLLLASILPSQDELVKEKMNIFKKMDDAVTTQASSIIPNNFMRIRPPDGRNALSDVIDIALSRFREDNK